MSPWCRIYASANRVIIGSDNGFLPVMHRAIIKINDGLLLNGPLATNFSEISIKIQSFSCTKLQLKILSVKWRPFRPGDGLTVLLHALTPGAEVLKWHNNMLCKICRWSLHSLFPLASYYKLALYKSRSHMLLSHDDIALCCQMFLNYPYILVSVSQEDLSHYSMSSCLGLRLPEAW